LDWSVGAGADAVIVELGANDVLHGIDTRVTRTALDRILSRLAARRLPVLLAGMRAPPNLGAAYSADFDGIFPELAARYGVLYYPFFLDGVATDSSLNLGDGIHPNPGRREGNRRTNPARGRETRGKSREIGQSTAGMKKTYRRVTSLLRHAIL
jgi:acyl-CoA thioesterase-1